MTDLVEAHVGWCRLRGLADGTVYRRRAEVAGWLAWCAGAGVAWQEATRLHVEAWVGGRPLGARARYSAISHLHSWYRWALRQGVATVDPTELVERPKLAPRLPRPAPGDVVADVLRRAPSPAWALAWSLAAGAGLRCCELARLSWGDVDLVAATVRVEGKGGRDRVVPLPASVVAVLARSDQTTGPVVAAPSGARYRPARLSQRGNELLRRLGAGVTMHQLRHYYATRVLEAGGDIADVQALLGHASPATSAIYARCSTARLRRVVDAWEQLAA